MPCPHPALARITTFSPGLLLFLAVFAQFFQLRAPPGLLFQNGRSCSVAAWQLPQELVATVGALAEGLHQGGSAPSQPSSGWPALQTALLLFLARAPFLVALV